jgi:hypothetical protein
MHVRGQVREAVRTAISGNGVVAECSRSFSVDESQMPRYLVYTNRDLIDDSMSTNQGHMRILTLVVEAVTLCTPSNVDAVLEAHCVYLENTLNWSRLGGIVTSVSLKGTDIDLNTDADSIYGKAVMTFEIQYRNQIGNSEVLT